MPKKKVTPRKKAQDYSFKIAIVVFGAFMLFLLGISFLLMKDLKPQCANSISCIKDLSGKKEADKEGIFMGKKVAVPEDSTPSSLAMDQSKAVLGDSTGGDKHIYVDLTNQRLYAYQGSQLVYNFLISSGKWNPTPTGDFHIWIWLRYTRMVGGSIAKGDYYNLPNVPFTMYFYNDNVSKADGYSLHGAYWHNNFGHPMSHGCINMKVADAEKMFYWTNPTAKGTTYPTAANPGTLITIYGTTPLN